MADPVLTAKLVAVNTILSTLNESPVNTLGTAASALAQHAEDMLDRVNTEVQSQGWEFNIEYDVELLESGGRIALPANAAWVHVPGTFGTSTTQSYALYTTRDGYLYNRKTKTDADFTGPIKATVCSLLEFSKIPEIARSYIVHQASRRLADNVRPNPSRHATMMRDELMAKQNLQEQEGLQGDFTCFDNYDAYQALARRNAALEGPQWY